MHIIFHQLKSGAYSSNAPFSWALDAFLSASMQEHVQATFSWEHPMLFFPSDGAAVVNLSEAVGDDARISYNALDQPDVFLNGSKFCLPGVIGHDKNTKDRIVKFFSLVCEGTSLTDNAT